jgi:hypothetical protein
MRHGIEQLTHSSAAYPGALRRPAANQSAVETDQRNNRQGWPPLSLV